MVTDAAGGVASVHHDFGFGEELNTTTTAESKRFTGHERDFHAAGSQDDLDYMHARYYKAHLGRFLTVDPVIGSPEEPGSWNRYAYVLNSPTNLVDPDGLVAGPATLLLQNISELCLIRGLCSNEVVTVTSTPLPVLSGGFGHVAADRVQRFPKEFTLELAGAFFDFVFEEPDRTICYERNGEIQCGEILLGMAPNPLDFKKAILNKTARELIPAFAKKSKSYREELADLTYGQILSLARSRSPKANDAKKMKKLIEQSNKRLREKRKGKQR